MTKVCPWLIVGELLFTQKTIKPPHVLKYLPRLDYKHMFGQLRAKGETERDYQLELCRKRFIL